MARAVASSVTRTCCKPVLRSDLIAAAFDVPRVGIWDVHLVIRRGDDRYVLDERVTFR